MTKIRVPAHEKFAQSWAKEWAPRNKDTAALIYLYGGLHIADRVMQLLRKLSFCDACADEVTQAVINEIWEDLVNYCGMENHAD